MGGYAANPTNLGYGASPEAIAHALPFIQMV